MFGSGGQDKIRPLWRHYYSGKFLPPPYSFIQVCLHMPYSETDTIVPLQERKDSSSSSTPTIANVLKKQDKNCIGSSSTVR